MTLLLATLAIFFAWETVLSVVPWTIPPVIQPVLVYGAALAFSWPDWRFALSVAGAVALLHTVTVLRGGTGPQGPTQMVRRPGRAPRVPNLP